MIKIYGALEDLLMGHSSWFEYGATNRIFKYYTFDWHANAAAKTVSFSSYPVCVFVCVCVRVFVT